MAGYNWNGPKPSLDGHFYAVAVRNGHTLYLSFWVRRAAKGDIYGFIPRETPPEMRRFEGCGVGWTGLSPSSIGCRGELSL